MWPKDETIVQRLKRDPNSSEARRLCDLRRFRREVTGLTSAYEHVLKVVDSDRPHADVYLQGVNGSESVRDHWSKFRLKGSFAVKQRFPALSRRLNGHILFFQV